MYPQHLVAPMKADLVSAGFQELTSEAEVASFMAGHTEGTTLVVVNSVCGCAAGTCRPGVKLALENASVKPDHLVTVFAGVDGEATVKMREYFLPYPPSSPAIAIFKDGELAHMIERHHIEGRSAQMIAAHLEGAFEEICAA
jgi:putative YphP/YqiW family bacilliredoxin